MSDLTGLFIGIAPFVALMLWCEVRDRRRDLADGVRAEIHAAARRVLGGESIVLLPLPSEGANTRRRERVALSALR